MKKKGLYALLGLVSIIALSGCTKMITASGEATAYKFTETYNGYRHVVIDDFMSADVTPGDGYGLSIELSSNLHDLLRVYQSGDTLYIKWKSDNITISGINIDINITLPVYMFESLTMGVDTKCFINSGFETAVFSAKLGVSSVLTGVVRSSNELNIETDVDATVLVNQILSSDFKPVTSLTLGTSSSIDLGRIVLSNTEVRADVSAVATFNIADGAYLGYNLGVSSMIDVTGAYVPGSPQILGVGAMIDQN